MVAGGSRRVDRPRWSGRNGARALVASAWLAFAASAALADVLPAPPRRAAPPRPEGAREVPAGVALAAALAGAPPGAVLALAPGHYRGPLVIDRPVTLWGPPDAVVRSDGTGTTIEVKAAGVSLLGFTVEGSGRRFEDTDAAVHLRGDDARVEGLRVTGALFGIAASGVHRARIAGNEVVGSGLPDFGLRGDAIRLWEVRDSVVAGNHVTDSRDTVVWYSNGNKIINNVGRRCRYSLHFMFSQYNLVENNRYYDNTVGIYVMYTDGVILRNNLVSHATGATGMGIGFKEASSALVEGNDIIYCATGMGSDLSPFQPGTQIWIRNNRIAYNGVGILFNSDRSGNVVTDNAFEGNLTQVAVNGAGTANKNEWRGNYWDDYQGFDRNRDGRGDSPYELYTHADRIWMETPHARFFKNAPLMEALDFLEQLAPFSTPDLMLRDASARFDKPVRGQHGFRS